MVAHEREKLPFRKNCEGYFLDDNGNVLALDSGKGYLIFPGGGIGEGENPKQALLREAYEETGVVMDGELKELGMLQIIWGEDWAKTDKQKERYKKFKGDEMHFFVGKIKQFEKIKSKEDTWKGEKLMPIAKAIEIIENARPFSKTLEEYYTFQLHTLRSLLESKEVSS